MRGDAWGLEHKTNRSYRQKPVEKRSKGILDAVLAETKVLLHLLLDTGLVSNEYGFDKIKHGVSVFAREQLSSLLKGEAVEVVINKGERDPDGLAYRFPPKKFNESDGNPDINTLIKTALEFKRKAKDIVVARRLINAIDSAMPTLGEVRGDAQMLREQLARLIEEAGERVTPKRETRLFQGPSLPKPQKGPATKRPKSKRGKDVPPGHRKKRRRRK